ncbi:MAG: dihydroorotase [Planctomycetota bacterium]|nr:dihydroorotase [Planctomycetota bacterium]
MSRVLIRGGHVVDPESGWDGVGDVLIEDDRIAQVGSAGADPCSDDLEVIDAEGRLVTPGIIDMHVHLREPGDEEEETISSGVRAAVAGGITSVACFPNTEPAIDNEGAAEFVVLQGKRAAHANVFPVGAVTLGREGKELAEMAGLARAGAVAFSDSERSIRSAEIMRRGLLYAKMFERPVITHCEDEDLRRDGVMNYGKMALRLGLPGIPDVAESIVVARDIELAEITRGRLHIGQMSTQESVALLERAKAASLDVTGEVTPHHFSLTDESCKDFDPNFKVLPPLRTREDIDALLGGLRRGVIDVIASGHAPHTPEEKAVEFELAPFGVIGMETLFPVCYSVLVERHAFPLILVLEKLTINPARILGLAEERGGLVPGKIADVSIFDLEEPFVVDGASCESKSRNTCFEGWRLRGRATHVLVGGRLVFERRPGV